MSFHGIERCRITSETQTLRNLSRDSLIMSVETISCRTLPVEPFLTSGFLT